MLLAWVRSPTGVGRGKTCFAHYCAMLLGFCSHTGIDVGKLEAAAAASGKAAASKAVARSDQIVLVKNLPYSSRYACLHLFVIQPSRVEPVVRIYQILLVKVLLGGGYT